MSYPTAYRSTARQSFGGGFQGPARSWSDYVKPQVPNVPAANDNLRLPFPANDNVAGVLKLKPGASWLRRASFNGMRFGARFAPGLAFFMLLLDLYDLYRTMGQPALNGEVDMTGWTTNCGVPQGTAIGQSWGCGNSLTVSKTDWTKYLGYPVPRLIGSWQMSYWENLRPHWLNPTTHWNVDIKGNFYKFGTNNYPWRRYFTDATYDPFLEVDPVVITPPYRFWKEVKPNTDAPTPIRREVGPSRRAETKTDTSEWWQKVNDPFRYPRIESPDIVIEVPPLRTKARTDTKTRQRTRIEDETSTGVETRTNSHRYTKPTDGTKERKQRVSPSLFRAYQAFARRFGQFTEVSDAVDCVYKALPAKVQKQAAAKRHGKKPSIQGKLRIIYDNYERIDFESMAKCLITENLKDMVIGKVAKRHAEARKAFGIRGGYLSRLAKFPSVNLPSL